MKKPNKITEYLKDPQKFRFEHRILDNGKKYGDCYDDWQEDKIFKPISQNQFNYIELARGHDKTGSLAWLALESVVKFQPEQNIIIAACDKDQAKILLDSAKAYIRRAPNILGGFEVRNYEIIAPSKNSVIQVISSDAPSSYGHKPTMIIFDELNNFSKRDLFDSLITSSGKIPGCKVIVITNAGSSLSDWRWEFREHCRKSKDWYFYSADGCIASWISNEWIEQMRRTLPPFVFQRLIENKWTTGEGRFLTREEIFACRDDNLKQRLAGEDTQYIYSLDLGIKKDRTCAIIAHRDAVNDLIVVDSVNSWEGSADNPVTIADVEEHIEDSFRRFNITKILCDPWQAYNSIQSLRAKGFPIDEFKFSTSNLERLSNTLFSVFRNKQIKFYPHNELEKELQEIKVIEKSYGWRIDHESGKFSDHVIALGIAVIGCIDYLMTRDLSDADLQVMQDSNNSFENTRETAPLLNGLSWDRIPLPRPLNEDFYNRETAFL